MVRQSNCISPNFVDKQIIALELVLVPAGTAVRKPRMEAAGPNVGLA
jgi:hypothetical protein